MRTIADDLLRWPRERITAIQDERVRITVQRCYASHPYYGELMRSRGLTPDDIRSVADLERLPVTTKAEFVADPERFRLTADTDGVGTMNGVAQVVYTTGSTTGAPSPVYDSAADRYDYMIRARRRRDFIDIRRSDLVAVLLPLTPYPMGAYGRALSEITACGAAAFFANPGHRPHENSPHHRVDEILEMLVERRPTVLYGISSFVRSVLSRLADAGGRLPELRMLMVTGEASTPKMLANLSDGMRAVGASAVEVVNRYGSTEAASSMVECSPGSGFHDLAPDSLFLEVVDPESGRRLPDGQRGSLAFTHLNRSGTVLLRYAVGDQAAISHEPCPRCARTGSARLVEGPTRTGDIVKVKGMLVNLAAVCDSVEDLADVSLVQLLVDRVDGADRLEVRTVPHGARSGSDEQLTEQIEARVRELAQISPVVRLMTREDFAFAATGDKFKRIADLRVRVE